jgi:hypothetical protein
VDFVSFEDGKLMLDIDFYFERSRSTDSSLERSYVTFELDKSLFGGEEIKEVVLNFNLAFFDVCISNIENGKSRTTNFGWSGRGYIFDSIIGKRAAWSDRIDSTLTFGYTFEIIETELIGYEDDIYYKTITVPTGEKRVIKYNSELGICVEGNRSLQLTDKQNEYFKLLVSSLN